MKNRKLIVIVGLIVLAVVGIGYYLLSSSKKTANKPQSLTQSSGEQQIQDIIPTISAEDIGLSLTSAFNNRKVLIQISKTEGLSTVDYQLSYLSKGSVSRGVIGQIQIQRGKQGSQEIVLGTCSDVCHYDEGVKSVELTLKVTKADGKTYQLIKSLNFNTFDSN